MGGFRMKGAATKRVIEESVEERMFVTISIGEDKFGVDVNKIQEIMGIPEIARVPNVMPFMKGVTNLRGKVIPLVDLRIKFHMPEREYDKLTVVMIAEIKGTLVGLIVDSVSDVISMPLTNIQKTPHFSSSFDTDCIDGIGKLDDQIVIIIDVDKIFTDDELARISEE